MFDNISTKTLIEMNGTYLREYRANGAEGSRMAVVQTDRELSKRNA